MVGAVNPKIAVLNPQGPIIRQAKLMVTRRLSNVIMVRGGLYTYEKQKDMEIYIMCEAFREGVWQCVETYFAKAHDTDTLEDYHEFQCEPNTFHRVLGFCMVNNTVGDKFERQRELVQVKGLWNNWGRDDGLDEPRSTPLDLFYDGVSLPPVEERSSYPIAQRNKTRK